MFSAEQLQQYNEVWLFMDGYVKEILRWNMFGEI